MTTTKSQQVIELEREIAAVENEVVAVEHNEGTFSEAECRHHTGCGDTRYGNYTIYERVGGGKRHIEGCDPEKAPGYARKGGYAALADRRKYLSELRRQLRQAR